MINKIHAVWLGDKMSPFSLACVDDWIKQGYDVKVWTEKDPEVLSWIDNCEFAKACLSRGLYAFVSDYLRLKVLAEHGGLYLDTDVTIRRDPFGLFHHCDFGVGYEDSENVGTAVIYALPHSSVLKKTIDFYENEILSSPYFMGPKIMTEMINRHKKDSCLEHEVRIFEKDTFYFYNGDGVIPDFPSTSYLVHWFQHSWKNSRKEVYLKSKHLGFWGKLYVYQKYLFRFRMK
ncbi:mannosyltransferase [Salinivibrio sp. PR5]|uniref:glycosyltransferase family 32 protein n=1 Tax=Salinivibrio sp. PR5 TaxID=1909484 RepID=UPI00098A5F2D|nr:glycosyltransferase [Salinivibrio sp. PR5]OOF08165.1 mannosyltransferase [Salinivibrio sp. PR5]